MKVKFETEDPVEIRRLAKSSDMAMCLWEIVYNSWREFKHTDYDYERYQNKILEILEEFRIDVDDLIDG